MTYVTWLDIDAEGRPVDVDANGVARVGLNPKGFGNTASLDDDGLVSSVSRTVKRTAQGGAGTGTDTKPAVGIEKYSGTGAGVTGLDAAGQPTKLPAGDHGAAPLEVTDGSATPITMRTPPRATRCWTA